MEPSRDISRLIEIMAALRDPETGCPWDIEQDFHTIAPYTVEEAHEVADAIARGDRGDLCDELGDLLLQVVYHAQLAEEEGSFVFADVVEAITTKMIRRHPHVFGDESARSAGVAKGFWERIKQEERRKKGEDAPARLLDDVGASLPPLARALKLQKKAATVGFDWDDKRRVIDKMREELDELEAEILREAENRDAVETELGDLLFTVVNLARHVGADSGHALERTNAKFVQRLAIVEDELASRGTSLRDADLDEMEALWQQAKNAAE